MDSWIFNGRESTRWVVEHPLPIFLCVVDKSSARLRLYHTSPRFYIWSLPPLPSRLELIPTTESIGKCTQWDEVTQASLGTTFSLSAPILDASIQEFLDDDFHRNAWEILRIWIDVDLENLQRINAGIHSFTMPSQYCTNSTAVSGWATQGIGKAEDIERAIKHSELTP